VAGLATHRSADPGTLVVTMEFEAREWLLEDAPDTYYLTDHYRRYLVVVRLSRIGAAILRYLLSVSWRLMLANVGRRVRSRHVETQKTP
jgi:hypothetical protein